MKITDVVFKHIQDVNKMPRFDMVEKPRKSTWYLQLLAWVLSFPETFMVKARIHKVNMKGLKGPYIMLCNHNSFLDFKVATRAVFPRSSNYVVAIDGFINREKLLRNVGGIGKRKFVSETLVVKNIKYSLTNLKQICQLYPEARYSLTGTTSILPESLSKLVKYLKYPVVTLVSHGHHLRQPVWNLHKRRVRTKTDMIQLISQEEIETLNMEEINQRIQKAFIYDDYKYQLEEKIKIKYKNRAKNIHLILYQCPHCHTEFKMNSDKSQLWCDHCHSRYEMDVYGQLKNLNGDTIFSHIPDWFEWQRLNVRKEILNHNYDVSLPVYVDSLPNSTGFYRLGLGLLKHNTKGFELSVEQEDNHLHIIKHPLENYGVHVEYNYFGRGHCISFSSPNDTFYIYPVDQSYSVTKFHFAVEELYKCVTLKEI